MKIASLFLVPALLATQLASASVVLLEDNRAIESWLLPSLITPTSPFSHFAVPQQSSYVTPSGMIGSGTGSTHLEGRMVPENVFKRSIFSVTFEVEEAQPLQLDATLKANSQNCYGCSSVSFSLTGPNGFTALTGLAQDSPSAAQTGVTYTGSPNVSFSTLIDLTPGIYTLFFGTDDYVQDGYPFDSSSSSWSFEAKFPNEVPLPATGWMLLSALGSLGAARKLRQRKA